MARTRVYVAGAYSADNVITVLDNMRRGMRAGTQLMVRGFAPFVPWFDYHFQLMLRNGENLGVKDYYEYSIAWLEAADVVYVLPNSEHSRGTKAEVERAELLDIPVYYSMEKLLEFEA